MTDLVLLNYSTREMRLKKATENAYRIDSLFLLYALIVCFNLGNLNIKPFYLTRFVKSQRFSLTSL